MWFGPGWCCPPPCDPPVPEVTCGGSCDNDTSAEFWHCDIPSPWIDDSCTGCAGLPGEWIVPHLTSDFASCTWRRDIRPDLTSLEFYDGTTCVDIINTNPGIARIEIVVSRFGSPTVYQAMVSVMWGRSTSFADIHRWRLQQASPFDCLAPIVVPFFQRTWAHSGFIHACAENNADVTLTPAPAP